VRLRELRGECPEWTWHAERAGFGWTYVGCRDGKRVLVYAVSMLCGPSDDDFATQWRVDDGKTTRDYATWWCDVALA